MSDINTGGEHWGNDWIERVETAAEKYGVECHGVPLNVGWFLNLLDAAVEKERAEVIDEFVNVLEKHQQENWIDNLEYGITFADIEEVAEQLKEQSKK